VGKVLGASEAGTAGREGDLAVRALHAALGNEESLLPLTELLYGAGQVAQVFSRVVLTSGVHFLSVPLGRVRQALVWFAKR